MEEPCVSPAPRTLLTCAVGTVFSVNFPEDHEELQVSNFPEDCEVPPVSISEMNMLGQDQRRPTQVETEMSKNSPRQGNRHSCR